MTLNRIARALDTRQPKDTIAVELADHGRFVTSLVTYTRVENYSQRVLAKLIAEGYGGGCGKASTQTYWRQYGRGILAVVYGGMVEPKD
jgi:hypothetical protein